MDVTDLASRNLERRIITASHVLCFSCIWMELNFRWMIPTMRSISLGEMGRVRDCSLSRFITWVVNSLHACWVRRRHKGEMREESPGDVIYEYRRQLAERRVNLNTFWLKR